MTVNSQIFYIIHKNPTTYGYFNVQFTLVSLINDINFFKKMFIPLESHGENSEAWNRNKILSLFRRTGNEQFTLESSL